MGLSVSYGVDPLGLSPNIIEGSSSKSSKSSKKKSATKPLDIKASANDLLDRVQSVDAGEYQAYIDEPFNVSDMDDALRLKIAGNIFLHLQANHLNGGCVSSLPKKNDDNPEAFRAWFVSTVTWLGEVSPASDEE